MIPTKIYQGLIVALIASTAWNYSVASGAKLELAETRSELSAYQTANKGQDKALKQCSNQLSGLLISDADYKQKLSDTRQEITSTKKELEKYRDRQDVVFQKPTLVQRLEQKALDKFFDDVESQNE